MATAKAEIQVVATGANQANAQLGQVATTLTRLGVVGQTVSGLLGGIFGAGFLGTAGVAAAITGLRSIAGGMEEVYEASKKVGLSVESLSGLEYAAEQSGLGFDQLTGGLVKFSKAINEARTGNKELAAIIDSVGIKSTDGLEQALEKVARQFKGMPESIEKTAIATKLFGRSGADLIEFLDLGADGLAAMREEAAKTGQVMSTEAAAAADKFNDDLTALGRAAEGVAIALVGNMLPSLTSVIEKLKEAILNANGFVSAINNIGTALGSAVYKNWNGMEAVQVQMAEAVTEIAKLRAENEKLNKTEWWFGDDARIAAIQKNNAEIAGWVAKHKELSDSYVRLNK